MLEGASITNLGERMEASLVGRNVRLARSNSRPKAYRFMIGDNSEVEIR